MDNHPIYSDPRYIKAERETKTLWAKLQTFTEFQKGHGRGAKALHSWFTATNALTHLYDLIATELYSKREAEVLAYMKGIGVDWAAVTQRTNGLF